MSRYAVYLGFFAALAACSGCKNEPEAAADKDQRPDRQIGDFKETGPDRTATTRPTGAGATLPAGHVPIGGAGDRMPDDPLHAAIKPPDVAPVFTAPIDWQPKPARMYVNQVFALPKVEGDAEDAELTVSSLGHVPLDANVTRWCGQFGIKDPKQCAEAAKRSKLEGTKFPTTIVEISGTYQQSGGPMMQAIGDPKPNYRMLAAELVAPQSRWFVKMVGPEKTVEHWREAFMKYVREARTGSQ
ncbi:MAG: hypothetical protein HRF43_10855 [Phycisphaerae bacterium]|jgi:hypothetical protein